MKLLAGMDIGGTKCAASLAEWSEEGLNILTRREFPTSGTPYEVIDRLSEILEDIMTEHDANKVEAIGISCGGPLNSRKGVILSPPNLPGWDNIEIVSRLEKRFDTPVALQNDANAGAMAEWRWGAGKGTSNMIFLTFGTGMGAGLILDGRLYSGTNDLAGEVGHIRLENDGPVGFGKAGSFEGYCSGGGIARLAIQKAEQAIAEGNAPSYCQTKDELEAITAKKVAMAANEGDKTALEVFHIVGKQLGRGVSTLIDILNPEKVIIGSIYGRQQELLEPLLYEELKKETIDLSLSVCEITPTGLGESIGDYASFSVALLALENR
ncbi:ROK family protein [Thalassobacillus pellis]|uniref:ROK family protein n=1 Tax=Thalassobacillus pellis TaxID=748008 RepID=UPI00195F387F|nr:ROK family protein [Thalassobacillus pellis]MBM7551536.1 glucokinase [Thalassobacillus pellis]